MYPLDFEEFAIANGLCSDTIVYLKKCYENIVPVTESVQQSMLKLFRYYIIVGGMPAAVEKFVETQSIAEVLNVQNNLISLYRQDIIKYSSSGQKKIKTIFDMIPAELNDKNRRFMLSDIKITARMLRYESSFN